MTITTSPKQPESSLEVDDAAIREGTNYLRSQCQTQIMEGAAAATNLGALFFCNGDLSSAMEFFREALLDVKLAFAQDESTIDDDSLRRAAHRVAQANPGGSSSVSCPFDCPAKSLMETIEQDFFHDDVFLHPLTIQAPTIDQCGIHYFSYDSDIDSSIFSAVIIYNMAISTHEMTRLSRPGQRQNAFMHRTNALYDMCQQLLTNAMEQIDLVGGESPASLVVKNIGRAMIDLINMAIVNNQAQLFVDSIDRQLTFLHVDHLVDLASAAREQNYSDERLNTAVHSVAAFFLMNATQPRLFRYSAAPAA